MNMGLTARPIGKLKPMFKKIENDSIKQKIEANRKRKK